MKILFASSSSGSRGGGETFLVYLGEALAWRGHEVALWTSSHPRMDEIAGRFATFGAVHRADYTNTYDRRRRSLAAALDGKTAARAVREWEALKPDIIHLNKQNLEDGLDLLRAAGRIACPGVCTIHITQDAAYLGAKGAWLRDWVSRRALGKYRGALVTVSEPRKKDLEAFLGPGVAVAAIANGVPIPPPLSTSERARRRGEMGLAPDDLAILAVGRMTAQKRPLLFLEIAGRILAGVPEAKFFWIGDGPLAAEWDAKATALGIAPQAQRLGWREDVAALLGCGDLLLHTAEYEGMPLAILEAMAAGLPCALSETLYREMPFLDESNSICVSGDDALIAVLRDREELGRRAGAAGELAAAQFSTAAMAAAYEGLYRERRGGCGGRWGMGRMGRLIAPLPGEVDLVQAVFSTEAIGQEAGVQKLFEQHLFSAPFAEGNAAVVFAGGSDVDGAGEGKRIELPPTGALRVAEFEMAAIDHEEVRLRVSHLAGEIGGLAMDQGGGAADEVEIAPAVKPWAAGGVDVSVHDVPAGMRGILPAPGGEAAMHAIVGIGEHDVARGEVAGGDQAALELLVLVEHPCGGGALGNGEIILDDGEIGMAEGHRRGLVADQENTEGAGGLGANRAEGALAQGRHQGPVRRGLRALERHDEDEHAPPVRARAGPGGKPISGGFGNKTPLFPSH